MDWQAFFPLLLASGVEWVEGVAAVLSVGLTIGWGASIGATLVAVVTLAVFVAVTGCAINLGLHGWILLLAIGVLLLRFGLGRLSKAIARQAGLKGPPGFQKTRPDLYGAERLDAWLVVFKIVLLEGLEVWLMVVGFSLRGGAWASNVLTVLAALVAVCLVGAPIRASLRNLPENTIKLLTGATIASFGTFWTLESLAGNVWPLGDWSLLALFAFYGLGGQVLLLMGRRRSSRAEA
jgi:uncharacterized membrane protein